MNAPGASGRRPVPPPGRSDPYRPYGAPGASGAPRSYRGPSAPGAGGARGMSGAQRAVGPYRGAGAPGAWRNDPFAASMAGGYQTSAHLEAIQRKRNGFALFHDGNAGHLWRGEVESLLGESVLSVGVAIWLAYLTSWPVMVMLGVLALGLPWLVAMPLAPIFERVREPGGPLRWMGRLRAVAALGVLAMHFQTIYPVLFGLLFAIGLTGRLRQSLRVAATRVCLEPGEVELVANDLFAGSAVAVVIGPLLAAIFFMALGERVILVALAAAVFFLLASNSDGFLDALPEEQRAFLHAAPATAAPDEATRNDLLAAARGADAEDNDGGGIGHVEAPLSPNQRELALPEWYQQRPGNPFQVIGDIRAGIGLAGGRAASATALLTQAALALAGGGLSVLEIFFVTDRLGLPGYYFGVLAALEAGGLTLGALLASMLPARKTGGALAPLGLVLTGVALATLGLSPAPVISYGAALAMGLANGMSVIAARQLLRAGRDGAERRALSAAEGYIAALAGAGGAVLFTLFYAGFARASVGPVALFPGFPISLILGGAGAGLALTGVILFINPGLRERAPKAKTTPGTGAAPGASGRFASPAGLSGKMGAVGATGATGAVGALWGDDADEDAYADEDEYGDEYEDSDGYDEDEDAGDDWRGPARGRGAPRGGGRPPSGPRNRRGRW